MSALDKILQDLDSQPLAVQIKAQFLKDKNQPNVGLIILSGDEKGGVGKTTNAYNLAVMCAISGMSTLLIDLDAQQSSRKAAARRQKNEITPSFPAISLNLKSLNQGAGPEDTLDGSHIITTLMDLATKYDVIVCDAGGTDSEELRSVMASPLPVLQLMPYQCSHLDLETMPKMNKVVAASKIYSPHLRAFALLSRVDSRKRASLAREASDFIDKQSHIELLNVPIYERDAFQQAMKLGECVLEYEKRMKSRSDGKASAEIQALFKALFGSEVDMNQVNANNSEMEVA